MFEAGLVNAYRRRHIAAGFHRLQFSLLLRALLSTAQRVGAQNPYVKKTEDALERLRKLLL